MIIYRKPFKGGTIEFNDTRSELGYMLKCLYFFKNEMETLNPDGHAILDKFILGLEEELERRTE